MYNEQMEALISAALTNGTLTEKEKQILFKKAQAQGIDLDEFEMVLDARLVELEKAEKAIAAASAPKSTKYGDVRKCPVCGAMVPALAGVCAECGYEFTGLDVNSSAHKLQALIDKIIVDATEKKTEIRKSNKLSNRVEKGKIFSPLELAIEQIEEDTEERINNAILNFAVPNTKNDLFEFIVSLQSKVNEEEHGKAYLSKLDECVMKASLLFPDDSIFKNLLATQEQKQKKLKKEKMVKRLVWWSIAIILTLGLIYLDNGFA